MKSSLNDNFIFPGLFHILSQIWYRSVQCHRGTKRSSLRSPFLISDNSLGDFKGATFHLQWAQNVGNINKRNNHTHEFT